MSDQATLARVVIAEDEAIIRLDLREILESAGFEVVGETARGDEAVSLVAEHRPDLVILDIKMPGLDGIEAARAISAARTLQPLWSQPEAKPGRFEDGLDAAKTRFEGILTDLDLDIPKELAQ